MARVPALLACLVCVPGIVGAQQATVSPFLTRALATDTSVTVWIFGRPQYSLAQLATAVNQVGGQIRRQSEWLHAVSAEMPSAALRAARTRPEVRHMQPMARFVGPRPDPGLSALPAPPVRGAPPIESDYGSSAMPLRRLNMFPLAKLGFRGLGVRIAILDSGFETARSVFASTSVLAQRDFVFNDGVVRNQAGDDPTAQNHGTSTWSLLGANQPGTMIGIAADATYILAKTEDIRSETRVEEDNWVAAMEWADSLGAKIISSSLGYLCFPETCPANGFRYTFSQLNGDVAVTTVAADVATQRGITVVNAMGNEGPAPQTISTPADADSIISAGAVDSLGNLAPFSSRGPTADGRTKPDLTAPGMAVFLATPTSFSRGDGTSFSTPILAGAVALMKQIHPTFGPIEIRDALRLAGSNARAPDSNRGWGTPDVALAATFPQSITLIEPTDSILATTTPRFSWSAPNIPGFAQPVRYNLMIARDTTFANPLIDTVVTETQVDSPRSLTPGTRFFIRITARAADSVTLRVQPAIRYTVTGLAEPAPPLTLLFQNFPNPFPERSTGQSSTCIWFDVSSSGPVRLDILDLRGHVVKNFVPGSVFGTDLPAGRYGRQSQGATAGCSPDFSWNGTATNGEMAPQGVYLVRLETPDGTFFKRIVFTGAP